MSFAFGVDHVVEVRNLSVGVGDHREIDGSALCFLNVLFPAYVRLERIDAEADDLDVPLVEFGL